MFKVDFFVDDKHLARLMHGLNGVARDLHVVPVVNAEPTVNGGVRPRTHGSSIELFMDEVRKRNLTEIRAGKEGKEILNAIGLSPSNFDRVIKQAMKAGYVKRSGTAKKFLYTVRS